jgi:predicted transcriptional regulator
MANNLDRNRRHAPFLGADVGAEGSRLNHKRRNKIEIIRGILELCSSGSKKSNIIYRCNMNSVRLAPLLEALLCMGLLEKTSHSGLTDVYMTTLQGSRFLNSYSNTTAVEKSVMNLSKK